MDQTSSLLNIPEIYSIALKRHQQESQKFSSIHLFAKRVFSALHLFFATNFGETDKKAESLKNRLVSQLSKGSSNQTQLIDDYASMLWFGSFGDNSATGIVHTFLRKLKESSPQAHVSSSLIGKTPLDPSASYLFSSSEKSSSIPLPPPPSSPIQIKNSSASSPVDSPEEESVSGEVEEPAESSISEAEAIFQKKEAELSEILQQAKIPFSTAKRIVEDQKHNWEHLVGKENEQLHKLKGIKLFREKETGEVFLDISQKELGRGAVKKAKLVHRISLKNPSKIQIARISTGEKDKPHVQKFTSDIMREITIRKRISDLPHVLGITVRSYINKVGKQKHRYEMEVCDTNLSSLKKTTKDSHKKPLLDLLSIIGQLHQRGLVHMDLKPGNVLLTNGKIRLSDFGNTTEVGKPIIGRGTRFYAPLEVQEAVGKRSSSKELPLADPSIDMFAFGIILLKFEFPKIYAAYNNLPQGTTTLTTDLLENRLRAVHQSLQKIQSPMSDLILGLIDRVPQNRIDAHEAYERLKSIYKK